MKLNIFILIVILLVINYSENSYSKEKSVINQNINKNIISILIQFYPTFKPNSEIYLDIKNSELIFQHLVLRKYLDKTKKEIAYNPEPINIKLNRSEQFILRDTIINKFNENDLKDNYNTNFKDGISINILFVFNDGTIKDIDLINNFTDNQYTLLKFIINKIMKYKPSKERELYLNELNKMINIISESNKFKN